MLPTRLKEYQIVAFGELPQGALFAHYMSDDSPSADLLEVLFNMCKDIQDLRIKLGQFSVYDGGCFNVMSPANPVIYREAIATVSNYSRQSENQLDPGELTALRAVFGMFPQKTDLLSFGRTARADVDRLEQRGLVEVCGQLIVLTHAGVVRSFEEGFGRPF